MTRPRSSRQQELGCRADQAVDGVDPGAGVARDQSLHEPARVDRRTGAGLQVAGQHDLVELAGPDPLHRKGNRRLPLSCREGAVGVPDTGRRPGRRYCAEGGRQGQACTALAAGADRGDPPPVAAPPDHDLGYDEGASAARGRVEGERAKGHRPRPREADLIADNGGCGEVSPPRACVGEAVGAVGLTDGGPAPADEPLTAAHPADVVGTTREEIDERPGVIDLDGARHQWRRGTTRQRLGGHGASVSRVRA